MSRALDCSAWQRFPNILPYTCRFYDGGVHQCPWLRSFTCINECRYIIVTFVSFKTTFVEVTMHLFCTHYKGVAEEEEEEAIGTGLTCLQSWLVSSRQCFENIKMKNVTMTTPYRTHIKMCLQRDWDVITTDMLHRFVSSVPCKCCEKEWHYKMVKALLFKLLLECGAGLK